MSEQTKSRDCCLLHYKNCGQVACIVTPLAAFFRHHVNHIEKNVQNNALAMENGNCSILQKNESQATLRNQNHHSCRTQVILCMTNLIKSARVPC